MLTHRALLANIEQVAAVRAADDPRRRRRARRAAALPRLRPQRGARQRARAAGQAGAGRAVRPEGPLDLVEDEACTVVPVAPAGVRPLARGRATSPTGWRRCGWCSGSAPLAPDLIEAFTAAPGSRSTRATASPRPRPWSPAPCAASASDRLGRRRPARGRAPARRRARPRARRRGPGRDPGPRRQPVQRLLARRADGPDADGWWATGDVGFLDATGDLFLVDRLKELVIVSGFNVYPREVEDGDPRGPGVAEAAVIGVPDARPVRPWSPTCARRTRPETRSPPACAATARPAGPVQAADPHRGRRRAAAHGHRQGAEGPAARPRAPPRPGAAGVTEPAAPARPLYADGQAGPPVRRRPRGRHRAVCAELGETYDEVDIDDDPSCATVRRGDPGDPSSTAASTTSGGSTPTGCGRAHPAGPHPVEGGGTLSHVLAGGSCPNSGLFSRSQTPTVPRRSSLDRASTDPARAAAPTSGTETCQ